MKLKNVVNLMNTVNFSFVQFPKWNHRITDPHSRRHPTFHTYKTTKKRIFIFFISNKSIISFVFYCRHKEQTMESTESTQHSIDFSGKAEFSSLPFSKSATLTTMFSLLGRQLTSSEVETRLPIHLACVVDRSDSMSGKEIKMVKSSLEYVLEQLLPKDKFTLITFASDVTTDFSGKMSPEEVSKAQHRVSTIQASGGTFLSGGLLRGLEVLLAENEEMIPSLILFTDGMANVGIRSPEELKSTVRSTIDKSSSKPTLHTFGFGPSYSKEMLK
jgi:Mg-chelatase subunit ChlD